MKYIFPLILFLYLLAPAFSQVENTSTLKIRDIMKGEDFVGYLPERPVWSEDGKSILFSWNPDKDTLRSTYKVDVANKKISKVSVKGLKQLPSNGGSYNKAYSKKVYAKNGDLFLLNIENGQISQITNTIARESAPSFSGDEHFVVYKMEDNLYAWSIKDGSTMQISNFIHGTKKEETKTDAMNAWLEQDQLAYFEILQKRKGQD